MIKIIKSMELREDRRRIIDQKKAEIEVYLRKKGSRRPEWGEQWDTESMNYLLHLGTNGTIMKIFSQRLQNSSCLIVGVGAGGDALRLNSIAKYVVGIDISIHQMKIAKGLELNNCEFIVCDAEKLPLRETFFDAVIVRSTLHHLPNIQVSLAQIFNTLEEGGVLVVHEPGLLNPIALIGRKFFPTSAHTPGERPFTLNNLRNMFSSFDFNLLEINCFYLLSLIFPITLKKFKVPLKTVYKKLLVKALYAFDEMLLRTPLKHLAANFILIAIKKHACSSVYS